MGVAKTKKGKPMLFSKCAMCSSKTSRFIKKQEASGLLSSLGIRTPLIQVTVLGSILLLSYKMNKIIHTFLLAGDKFMPQMHLRQPWFTYGAYWHLLNTMNEYKKNQRNRNSRYIYQSELDKTCFQHNMAYSFKDLAWRTACDTVLRDNTFNIAKNPKYEYLRSFLDDL